MALHPDDPSVPSPGYQGVERVLGTVDGLKRFLKIQENPYHGLNFCQGTVSEMLMNPGAEIFDVIRYFGTATRSSMFTFVTFAVSRRFCRNLPGRRQRRLCQGSPGVQRRGYKYMLMPDHVPQTPGDPTTHLQSLAYDYGYIRGLIQSAAELS